MSSYIVNKKTIDSVITLISDAHKFSHYPLGSTQVKDLKELGYDLSKDQDCERLGNDMLRLNHRASGGRYNQDESVPNSYKLGYCRQKNIQGFKNLGCWLYQCSEGEAVEDSLYKAFRTIENKMAHALLCASEEYEKAKWGE